MSIRGSLLILVILAVLGIGLSFLVIPRERDIALMTLKDKEFDSARGAYEERWQRGDRTVSTVTPLTQLYLQYGEVDQAVAVMEQYVADQPNNIEARRILGTLYQYAQRPGDYLRNLEEIARRQPGEGVLRELAALYSFNAEQEQQLRVLRQLVEMAPEKPQYALALAHVLASTGRLGEASTVLASIDDRNPTTLDIGGRQMLFALLMDQGKSGEAVQRAEAWTMAGVMSPDELKAALARLVSASQAQLALRLAGPQESLAQNDQDFALIYAEIEQQVGDINAARKRLEQLLASQGIQDDLLSRFVELSVGDARIDLAINAVNASDPSLVSDSMLIQLVDEANRQGQREFTQRVLGTIGESFLEGRPVLGAELAFARGDTDDARFWVDRALARPEISLAERATLGSYLIRLGRRAEGTAVLTELSKRTDLPVEALGPLGNLYIAAGKTTEGLAFFTAERKRRPSPSVDAAWAKLATKAGAEEDVLAWLNQTPEVEPPVLQDLAFLAYEAKAKRVMLAASQRLVAKSGSPRDKTLLAQANLLNGNPQEALDIIRPMVETGGPPAEQLYVQALKDAQANDELRKYYEAQLNTPEITEDRRTELVYALIGLKDYEAVLPILRERADKMGDQWYYAYVDAALKSDHKQEIVDYTVESLKRGGLDQKQTAARVSTLIDRAPDLATPFLAQLAAADPAKYGDIYLEVLRRQKRNAEIVAFLEKRLTSEKLDRKQYEATVYALIAAGGTQRALPYIKRLADVDPKTWAVAYVDALRKAGRNGEAHNYLVAISTAGAPDVRRDAAYSLLKDGDKVNAAAAFQKLAETTGPEGKDFAEVKYLWGPRPDDQSLAWVEARARAAQGETRFTWLKYLTEAGGSERVRAVASGPGASTRDLKIYLDALRDDPGMKEQLDQALKNAVTGERDMGRLQVYAEAARTSGKRGRAEDLWQAILKRNPEDPTANKELGILYYGENRIALAVPRLQKYTSSPQSRGEFEPNYIYAEILTSNERPDAAAEFYRRALRSYDALVAARNTRRRARGPRNNEEFREDMIHASILSRLGRTNEALIAFERLRRERPQEAALIADYSGLLIDNGMHDRAKNVLAIR